MITSIVAYPKDWQSTVSHIILCANEHSFWPRHLTSRYRLPCARGPFSSFVRSYARRIVARPTGHLLEASSPYPQSRACCLPDKPRFSHTASSSFTSPLSGHHPILRYWPSRAFRTTKYTRVHHGRSGVALFFDVVVATLFRFWIR